MGSLQSHCQKIDRRGQGRFFEQILQAKLTMKNVSEYGRGVFQRRMFFHKRERRWISFRIQETHCAWNQNFKFRGHDRSLGRSHKRYSN